MQFEVDSNHLAKWIASMRIQFTGILDILYTGEPPNSGCVGNFDDVPQSEVEPQMEVALKIGNNT